MGGDHGQALPRRRRLPAAADEQLVVTEGSHAVASTA
jgi:hypothetical protein